MTAAAPAPTSTGTLVKPVNGKRRVRSVPNFLVRETIDGIPFYYRGYKEVLSKKKVLDDIMADSGLQTLLKKYLYDLLLRRLNPEVYDVYIGEVGAHLEHKSNLGIDVTVYETAQLPGEKFDFKYLDVAPKFAIEVDMKVSLDDTGMDTFAQFLDLKTQKLFDFGVERLIWVLTPSKKVVIATPGEDWLIVDWNKDIELWQGVKANIGQHLKARGINPDIFLRVNR
ncbi:MAG: Uma2 family endonuclease [Saprospiraceae bacterium]